MALSEEWQNILKHGLSGSLDYVQATYLPSSETTEPERQYTERAADQDTRFERDIPKSGSTIMGMNPTAVYLGGAVLAVVAAVAIIRS